MAEENVVTERMCKVVHKDVDRRLDSLDGCIKEIRDAVNEMREVSISSREIATVNKEILAFLVLQQDKKNEVAEAKQSFWDTKTGEKVPLFIFIGIIILIAALVGTNLIEGLTKAKDIMPK